MRQTVVIIGIGELGGVFAKGFLRLGHPVCPVTRDMDISNASNKLPEPLCVLVAVTEKDLPDVLTKVPVQWQDRLGLLQNELLPDRSREGLSGSSLIKLFSLIRASYERPAGNLDKSHLNSRFTPIRKFFRVDKALHRQVLPCGL